MRRIRAETEDGRAFPANDGIAGANDDEGPEPYPLITPSPTTTALPPTRTRVISPASLASIAM